MTENDTAQVGQANQPEKHNFPRIPLSSAEKLWLEAAYSKFKVGKRVMPAEIVTELWDKVPQDFDYKRIDERLLRADGITLLGIAHVDPNADLMGKTDQVIKCIRKMITTDPEILTVTAKQVGDNTGIPETEVGTIFVLMNQLGSFLGSATGGQKGGYASIYIEYEYVKREYLKYIALDELIKTFYITGEPKRIATATSSIPEKAQGSPVIDVQVSSRDFSFIQNERIASIVRRDYAELQRLDPDRCIKSVLVLSGEIIEALLVDALIVAKHCSLDDAFRLSLKEMVHPAKRLGIIQHDNMADSVRDFRNLIHATREMKDEIKFNEAHARNARTTVDVIISEIQAWHLRRETNAKA